jgi:hypothetical protein
VIEDARQIDGRRWIRERHRDDTGLDHDYVWMAEAGQATGPIVTARAVWLGTWLKDEELANVLAAIESGDTFVVRYNTLVEIGQAIRERYKVLTGEAVARVAKWALTRTDVELKAWFGGLNNSQLMALKTRLTSKVTALNSLNALVGE